MSAELDGEGGNRCGFRNHESPGASTVARRGAWLLVRACGHRKQ